MGAEDISALARTIRRRRLRAETRGGYGRLLIRIAVIAAAGWVLFTRIFLVGQAAGTDMFPAVKDGDLMIGFRLQNQFQQDDVVVYEAGGRLRTGRIIGIESDVITMDENGTLTVNGTVQGGEILFPTYPRSGEEESYTVSKGCVYILGDYRTQAEDSRDFGSIPLEDVKAKVITILRRRVL
ncbi:MAG: signal peptidase I [Ruminococcus sp.]|jgi:signal peptidase I